MNAPLNDLKTARRLATEEALARKAAEEQRTPKPQADDVRKGPSSVRIARGERHVH